MQILSFDIGIKNMAYCYARISDNDNNKTLDLLNLNKVDLNVSIKANTDSIINNTLEFLESIVNELKINKNEKLIVLIECQMTSKMRCIQTVISTYFKMIGMHEAYDIETSNLSAKHKLNIINKYEDKIGSNKYKQNKIDSIYFTKYLLENHYKNEKFLEIYNETKKKDDISDAFLMIIYFYENYIS
jgi:hypothetical protein